MVGGASMVKYTTPLPCIVWSESDSKLRTNFELCDEKYHKHLKNTLVHKTKQFVLTRKLQEKIQDDASRVCN